MRSVRFPRRGTISSRTQVDALGGADARRGVQPAVVRPLGDAAIYVQLTADVASATSEEARDKQARFSELAAPLLPPPIA